MNQFTQERYYTHVKQQGNEGNGNNDEDNQNPPIFNRHYQNLPIFNNDKDNQNLPMYPDDQSKFKGDTFPSFFFFHNN